MPRGVIIPCVYGCGRRFSGQESHDRHRDWANERCRSDHELVAKGFVQRERGIWQRDPKHRVSASVGQSALFGAVMPATTNGAVQPTEARVLARSSDPTTSARAAASAAPRTGTYKRLLFDAIAASVDGLTFEEAALRVGMDRWPASKRVSDLKRDGLVVVVGERPGASGKAQEVCAVAEQVSA